MKVAASLAAFYVSAVNAAIDAHEVTSLPGFEGPLPSKHYSGYLPVGATSGAGLGQARGATPFFFFSPPPLSSALRLEGGGGQSPRTWRVVSGGSFSQHDPASAAFAPLRRPPPRASARRQSPPRASRRQSSPRTV